MTSAEGEWTRVCAVEELRAAGRLERLIGRRAALLIWRNGAAVACDALCPHAAAPLIDGDISEGRLQCARHLASFDLATGEVSAGWRLPPLSIHETRISDGWVEIRLR